MQLSKKRKTLAQFFFFFFLPFLNLQSILSFFKKRMSVVADVFLNLRTPKDVVR